LTTPAPDPNAPIDFSAAQPLPYTPADPNDIAVTATPPADGSDAATLTGATISIAPTNETDQPKSPAVSVKPPEQQNNIDDFARRATGLTGGIAGSRIGERLFSGWGAFIGGLLGGLGSYYAPNAVPHSPDPPKLPDKPLDGVSPGDPGSPGYTD